MQCCIPRCPLCSPPCSEAARSVRQHFASAPKCCTPLSNHLPRQMQSLPPAAHYETQQGFLPGPVDSPQQDALLYTHTPREWCEASHRGRGKLPGLIEIARATSRGWAALPRTEQAKSRAGLVTAPAQPPAHHPLRQQARGERTWSSEDTCQLAGACQLPDVHLLRCLGLVLLLLLFALL